MHLRNCLWAAGLVSPEASFPHDLLFRRSNFIFSPTRLSITRNQVFSLVEGVWDCGTQARAAMGTLLACALLTVLSRRDQPVPPHSYTTIHQLASGLTRQFFPHSPTSLNRKMIPVLFLFFYIRATVVLIMLLVFFSFAGHFLSDS